MKPVTSFGKNSNRIRDSKESDCRVAMVLVFFTGGTIGMTPNSDGFLGPEKNKFEQRIRKDVKFHDPDYVLEDPTFLALPALTGHKRILYKIKEYNPLLDSSNMGIDDWKKIAQDIYAEYPYYDGFVVLHGTDTLVYTSSALSFMLKNLGKPVIVTGSQIPIYEPGSDGIKNFNLSLIFAGLSAIPEVGVVFGNKMLRGNRTVKVNCTELEAFESPNYPALATKCVEIIKNQERIIFSDMTQPFTEHSSMSPYVTLLRIVPDMPLSQIRACLESPVLGVVLQSFGAGNIPSKENYLLDELKKAINRGVIIVNCTQCLHGSVVDKYDTSSELKKIGVISLGDITMEAAYTKLSYVLGYSNWDLEKKRNMMEKCLRGEFTESE